MSLDPAPIGHPEGATPVPVHRVRWNTELVERARASAPDWGDETFVRDAGHAGRLLDAATFDALVDFRDGASPPAMLLRGVAIGEIGPTPQSPTAPTAKDRVSEFSLLTVARVLGQPVGYLPEHGGNVIQNLLPTRGDTTRQTSTSSRVALDFHTETAFHHHRPHYLLLLCLRGDPAAATTLCMIDDVLGAVPPGVEDTLRRPRFHTGVDESFGGGHSAAPLSVGPILAGTPQHPTLLFDADLMSGVDAQATDALRLLRTLVRDHHSSTYLQSGDLLVVDNSRCVHGRSPFTPRFDGTDRWLQRSFVVDDLSASATERVGRVITTRFAI